MHILLIGNGAREHAIAEAIKRSNTDVFLYTVGPKKNPGIEKLSEEYLLADVLDTEKIVAFAKEKNIEIVIPGAEAPLAAGIVDALQSVGIFSFGPTKSLARLETSKSFTRNILEKYGIEGNPQQKSFKTIDGLREYMEEMRDMAVKSDGLCGGKGVKLTGEHLHSIDEAYDFAVSCIEKDGGVVIEEKLEGEEFSYISLTDGKTVLHTFPIQDHKRAFEGDIGPNTGGMGTYNDEHLSLPFLEEKDLLEAGHITEQVFSALEKETGEKYVGVMYGGFMKTKNGIKLIEYNARFGDPEAMNILSLLLSDFIEFLLACKNKALDSYHLEFIKKASVVKYIVPESYPEKKASFTEVTIESVDTNTMLYYADCEEKDGKIRLGSSRGIAIVGFGDTLREAEIQAENGVAHIHGNVRHRKDIGTKEAIEKRIQHMNNILNS